MSSQKVWTEQEIFDTAVAGIRAQKAYSIEDNRCLYRGPNGTKCAIGFCIPDEVYSPDMEGNGADAKIIACHFPGISTAFLSLIQFHLHDKLAVGGFDANKFEFAAEEFANRHNLTFPLRAK